MAKNNKERCHYIRKGSVTVIPNDNELKELFALANKTPFDDRVNHCAEISDINYTLVKEYLKEIGSTLFADYKYSFVACKDAYLKGISYLTKLNAWPYVFSKLYKTYSKEQDAIAKDFSNLLKTSDMSTRVVCFVVDFLLPQ